MSRLDAESYSKKDLNKNQYTWNGPFGGWKYPADKCCFSCKGLTQKFVFLLGNQLFLRTKEVEKSIYPLRVSSSYAAHKRSTSHC